MFCQNCGTQNAETSQSCVKCGNRFQVQTPNPSDVNGEETPQAVVHDIPKQKKSPKNDYMTHLMTIGEVLLKPVTGLKKFLNNYEEPKSASIFTAIVVGIVTVINLITSIIITVRVDTSGWFSESNYEWVWENIKDVKWFDWIFKYFLIIAGVIAFIAVVYFVASIILKKTNNYWRMLAATTIAFIPVFLSSMIVGPILGWIAFDLAVIANIIGIIYTYVILIYGLNSELDLEDNDTKIYVNVACWAVITIVAYIVIRMMITSMLGNLLNFL